MKKYLIIFTCACILTACSSSSSSNKTSKEQAEQTSEAESLEPIEQTSEKDSEETSEPATQQVTEELDIVPVNFSSIEHLNEIIAYYNAITPGEKISADNVTETVNDDETETEIDVNGLIFRYSPTSSCVFYTCIENVDYTDENKKAFLEKAKYFIKASFPAMTDDDINKIISDILSEETPTQSARFNPSEEQLEEVYELQFDLKNNNGCFLQYYAADYYFNMSVNTTTEDDQDDDIKNFNYMFPDY